VPVPLPTSQTVNLHRPDAGEAAATACGIAWLVAPPTGLTRLQRVVLEALYVAMTDHQVDVSRCTPVTPEQFAHILERRNLAFRTRGIQVMLLCALILRPLPQEVADRIEEAARALGVDEGMVGVAREFAAGALDLAAADFERNGYTAGWSPAEASQLHTSHNLRSPWDSSVDDPGLAARWRALEHLPPDAIGRQVWEMYRARGFSFPGTPGSAPPLLAQHDWVHVLADFGTTVESELEVFAFIARANDDMHAFSLLAMVVSLFETGYLQTGAGLFEASEGHLSGNEAVAVRLADAMRRGAWCHDNVTGSDSIDFLRIDWLSLADTPVDELRARFSLRPKADEAIRAGSVGPRQRGGISPFQLAAGTRLAEDQGHPYDPYGAHP
jgi:hypothetical protein